METARALETFRARHRTRTVPYVRGRIYGAVHVPSARFTLTPYAVWHPLEAVYTL